MTRISLVKIAVISVIFIAYHLIDYFEKNIKKEDILILIIILSGISIMCGAAGIISGPDNQFGLDLWALWLMIAPPAVLIGVILYQKKDSITAHLEKYSLK